MSLYFLKKFFFYSFGVLLLFFLSCKNKIEEVNALVFVDTLPVETGTNIEIIYSENAQIKTIIKSPVYARYAGKDPYVEMKKGISAFFYDSLNQVKTKLTANYAIKYDKKNIMEVKNNVVVVNEKGETLNTEHLVWDEKQRKIYTDVFVKITTDDKIFYGDGLDADESFVKWVIRKPRGTFYINTDDE